ncbi:MAG: DNA polymerase III subunit delta [Beijerinckiaceae bacterium]
MVAIKNHEADRFSRGRSPNIWLYLFCGPDAGLVSERAQSIIRGSVSDQHDPFQLLRIDGDALAADPGKLLDEANTIGLFGGSRCVHIDAGARNFSQAVESLLEDPPSDCTIVITAGDLKADAPLRRLVSRYPQGAAVECYPDTTRQIEQIIDEEMKRSGLTITPGARELLAGHLGADRLVTRSEIEKLLLYMHGQKSVGEPQVEAIIADAASLNLDEAIFLAFTGDYRAATEAGYKTLAHLDAGVFIGFILRHVLLLHRLRIEIEKGASIDSVSERLPRNYFGQKKTQMQSQLRGWNSARLLQIANELAAAAASARRDPRGAERLAIRGLWWIVRGSRRAA